MTSDERIKVMVVDDHSIVREGLKHVLEQSGEFEVVGQAGDGEEAVRLAAEVSPDVVVMDVMMPRKDGVEACREIMESAPETRVVMLTVADEETAVVEAVAAGAAGYLRKETDRDRLLSTVRGVSRGELRLPAEVVRGVFAAVRDVAEAGDAADAAGLTEREREILVAFAGGTSYARIAEQRGIKPVTVRNAIYGIQQKLGITSMQGLVLWTARNGLLDDYDPESQG
ncbi:MAG: response regulator transcription factor [Chloroflexi bacterium]|nr:response regulator transcription factor [Chloroflexota bacterium]